MERDRLFEVLFEDESLLVVHKPADLVCHPTKGDIYSSLISRVRLYLPSEATGAHMIVHYTGNATSPTHPMVPVLQVSAETHVVERYAGDIDLDFAGMEVSDAVRQLSELVCKTAERAYKPRMFGRGTADFQLTRGLLGVSL